LGLAPEWFASLLSISLGAAIAGRAAFLKARMRAIRERGHLPRVDAQVERLDLSRIDAKPAPKCRLRVECLHGKEAIRLDFTIEAADLDAARASDRYKVLSQAFRAGEAVSLRAWRRLGATEYFADAGIYMLDDPNAGRELQSTLAALIIGGGMFVLLGVALFWIDL
jgi:hypothetical protein